MALSSSSSNPSRPTIPKLSAIQSTCQPPPPRDLHCACLFSFVLCFLCVSGVNPTQSGHTIIFLGCLIRFAGIGLRRERRGLWIPSFVKLSVLVSEC